MSPELTHLTALLLDIFSLEREEAPPSPAISDWYRWASLISSHHLAPLIGNRLAIGLPIENLPSPLATELKAAAAEETRESAMRELAFAHLRNLLAESEHPWIVLKGMAIVDDLYPARCERSMSDVDILLPTATACESITQRLMASGFRKGPPMPEHHHLPPLRDSSSMLSVELHHNLSAPPLTSGQMQYLFDRRIVAPGSLFPRLDDPARLFHHVLHIANDPIDTPLLRNLLECAALAQQMTDSAWEDFCRLAHDTDRLLPVAEVMSLASSLTGCPHLGTPSPSLLTFWMKRRLEWTAHPSRPTRWLRHLARRHIEYSQATGLFCPTPSSLLRSSLRMMASVMRSPFHSVSWSAPPFDSMDIASGTLIHCDDTGEVHLLRGEVARLWKSLQENPSNLPILLRGADREACRALQKTQLLRKKASP